MAQLSADAPEVVVPSAPKSEPKVEQDSESKWDTIPGKTLGLDYDLKVPKGMSKSEVRKSIGEEYPQITPEMLRLAIPDPPRSTGEKFARAGGLAVRNTVEGLTGTAVLGAHLLTSGYNDIRRGFNWAVGKMEDRDIGDENLSFQYSTPQVVQGLLSATGLPEPETPQERVIGAIQSGMVGAASGQFGMSRIGSPGMVVPGAVRGGPGPGAGSPAMPPGPVQNPAVARLSEGPLQQPIAGALGGAAGALAGEAGYGPGMQTAAGVVGGMIPGAKATASNVAHDAAFVGQNRAPGMRREDISAQNVRDFEAAGVKNPSAGMITEAPLMRSAEAVQSHLPGSRDVIHDKAEEIQSQIGEKASAISDQLEKGMTPAKAGRYIERALDGDKEGWRDRFKLYQDYLYDKSKALLPRDTLGSVSNYLAFLRDKTKIDPAAPATSAGNVNKELQQMLERLDSDLAGAQPLTVPTRNGPVAVGNARINTGGPRQWSPGQQPVPASGSGKLPYQTLFDIRQNIGERLRNPQEGSNTALLRQAYKALTKDMELMALEADVNSGQAKGPGAAIVVQAHNNGSAISDSVMESAKKQGGPATQALDRANAFTRAGHTRMDEVLDQAKGVAADIYKYTVDMPEMESGDRIARILRSMNPNRSLRPGETPLGPDLRDAVKAQFIRNMGRAKPGLQDPEGGVWSSQTFLTNWNKMGNAKDGQIAKDVMFAGMDGELRANLDAVARVSHNLSKGAAIFRNPSGTTPAAFAVGTATAVAAAVMTGAMGAAGLVVAGLAGQRMGSRMMFDPRFVKWLAETTRKPNGTLPAQLSILAQSYAQGDPESRKEIDNYISGVRANMNAVDRLKQQNSPSHFFTLKSMPTED